MGLIIYYSKKYRRHCILLPIAMLTRNLRFDPEQRVNLLDSLTCGPPESRRRSLAREKTDAASPAGPRRGARDSHAPRTGNIWWQGDGMERNGCDDHAADAHPLLRRRDMDPNKVSRMQQAAGPTQGLRDPRAVAECNQCTRAVRKSMWSIQAGRSIQNT